MSRVSRITVPPDDAAETIQTYGDAVKFIEANANA